MGRDTVCRVEENKHFKKPLIESINNIFNPTEKLERRIDAIYDIVKRFAGQSQLGNRSSDPVSESEKEDPQLYE